MNKKYSINDLITGAGGGKGGGSRTPREAPNTLQSRQTIKVQEILSEGEVVGIVGDLNGVFLDDTRIRNLDGSYNYPAIAYDFRSGTYNQTYMPGFPGVESAVVVNVEVDQPLTRTVSDSTVDAVRIGIRLPSGLFKIDTGNGDTNGYRVGIAIDVRPENTGTWSTAMTKWITGKATTAYEEAFRVDKPPTSGRWDVRVRRLSAKSSTNTATDRVDWFTMTEIQDIKVAYPGAAVVGLAIDAEATGGRVPARSYLLDGIICRVPVNYTPTTYSADGSVDRYASYTGVWNGTFKDSWCDDPAWILYNLLINKEWGFGQYLDGNGAGIDIYDFYEASRYNVELISKGDGSGGLEPRFTFNYQFAAREDAFRVLQTLAASFRAALLSAPGRIRLIQDRPQSPSKLINNTDVIDGIFVYAGVPLSKRTTAVDVSFVDRDADYVPRTVTEEDDVGISRYGYNKMEITPVGVTTEGQARRLAKWVIDSAVNAFDNVTFDVSWKHAMLEVGDVVEIADNWYAHVQFSGRIVPIEGGGVNQIRIDRSTTITAGTVIKYMTFTGQEETRTVATTATGTTFNLVAKTGALNPNAFGGVDYVVMGEVVPRQFKIAAISQTNERGKYNITAVQYDPTKYARIEQGIYVTPPVYTNIGGYTIGQPQNLTSTVETYLNKTGAVRYRLRLNWDDVNDQFLQNYKIRYRRDNGQFTWTEAILQSEYTIDDCLPGIYEYYVFAYNTRGVQSPSADGWYEIEAQLTTPSPLPSASNLRLDIGGTAFTGTSFVTVWNPIVSTVDATLMDYELRIYNGTSATAPLVKTLYVNEPTRTFTREEIVAWTTGGALDTAPRNIFIQVRGRDTRERLTLPVSATFTNAAPPVLTSVQITPGFEYYMVQHAASTAPDLAGIRIWASKTTGFTPGAANLVSDRVGTLHTVAAESDTTYFVRLAAYDTWSTQNLNMTSEFSVTTTSTVIGIVPTPPSNLSVSSALFESSPGNFEAKVDVSWTKSNNTDQYDLLIQAPSIGVSRVETVSQPPGNATTVSYTFNTKTAVPYTFQIRSRAATNVSEWSAVVSHTTVNTTVAPNVPTAFAVTPGYGFNALRWTNPTNSDLAGIQIWRRRITAPAVAEALVATVTTNSNVSLNAYSDGGLAENVQYGYRIRAVNRSGLVSAYTAQVNATTVVVDTTIPDGSITTDKIANGALTEAKFASNVSPPMIVTALPTTGNYEGRLAIMGGKIYRYTGGVWTANVLTSDLTGQITNVQITDDAITAPKLAANSVNTRNLIAGSVNTDKLAANSVTAEKVVAATLTGDKFVANTISARELTLTDTNNMVPDNQFQSNTSWSLGANTTLQTVTDVAGFISKGQITYTTPSGTTGWLQVGTSELFSVEPTDWLRSLAQFNLSAAGTVWARVHWYNASGAAITPANTTIYNGSLAAGFHEVTVNMNVPAGAKQARLVLYVNRDTTGAGTVVKFGGMGLFKMANANLIVDGSITATKIAALAVTTEKLAANAVTAGKIDAGAVTAREILGGTITGDKIAGGTITGNLIAGQTITADKLVANSIGAGQIDAGSVRAVVLVANSISSPMIQAGAITATHVAANTIITNSANIADAVITGAKIQNATIDGAKIINASIGVAQIADGNITNAKIQNGAIDSAKIASMISSDNYQWQTSGWAFEKNGNLYINGNAGGGTRMVISNANIQVYEGNVLRVRMGIW